ncbi:MAG: Phosphopantetheine adenylyltransferase [Bacteroidetes bacterium ADurb.Bin123]|jgi:pantetheine-phosphate adenylyltransferase|nr:MAG: Phosphopantetheine adenylyltransferase [Bacteroidetes bacterium ADurb.Bin123]
MAKRISFPEEKSLFTKFSIRFLVFAKIAVLWKIAFPFALNSIRYYLWLGFIKALLMEKIAIFPGSFDPFTIGHESIVRRAAGIFDRIIIMVGHNTNKKSYFPLEKRVKWIREVFEFDNNISVEVHDGLTVDFCKKVGARYILRGLRTSADFEFERAIAQVNKQMYPEIETVFLLTIPEHTPVNSTIVRDIIMHGGDASRFLPRNFTMNGFKPGITEQSETDSTDTPGTPSKQ